MLVSMRSNIVSSTPVTMMIFIVINVIPNISWRMIRKNAPNLLLNIVYNMRILKIAIFVKMGFISLMEIVFYNQLLKTVIFTIISTKALVLHVIKIS